jgi:hypothetical protein
MCSEPQTELLEILCVKLQKAGNVVWIVPAAAHFQPCAESQILGRGRFTILVPKSKTENSVYFNVADRCPFQKGDMPSCLILAPWLSTAYDR